MEAAEFELSLEIKTFTVPSRAAQRVSHWVFTKNEAGPVIQLFLVLAQDPAAVFPEETFDFNP